MSANASDHRQLRPLPDARPHIDLRRCRNCGDEFDLGDERTLHATRTKSRV